MKILAFIGLLLLGVLPAAMAQYSWFRQFSGTGYVNGTNLSISNDDAIYTIGNFDNNVAVFNNSFSGSGSFITKVTKQGILIWTAHVFSGTTDALIKIRSDGAGNIYIMGTCNQNVIIDGQTIFGNQGTSYVAKLNGDGHLLWFRQVPVQNIFDIDVNKPGELVLIGRLFGSISLDGNSLSCSQCSFGAALATNGTYRWAKTFGDQSFPISATIDDDANTYFNGTFWINFSLDGKNAVATGKYSLFYAKMNNLGNCSWLTSVKQTVPPSLEAGAGGMIVEFGAMKADGNGNVFAGGHYFNSVEFGSHVLQGSSNENATSFYISKFDSNGTVDWAVARVNNSTGNSIDNVVIKNNTVFVTGQNGVEIFIDEFSVAGNFIRETWVPIRGDVAGGFGIDSEDSLYVSGRINDYSSNKTTAFVLKLGTTIIPPPANSIIVSVVSCASEGIALTTNAIEHADVYVWEIVYKDKTILIETTVPSLLFMPLAYGIDGECQIRVSGKNENGTGTYSPYQTIRVDFPLSELQIEKRCDKIVATNGDSFKWFFNDMPAPYPDGQIEINPLDEGEYYIAQENTCGQKKSNLLNFIKPGIHRIPNIITPNNDTFNEFFVLSGFDDHTSVYIYNRWGGEVFHSKAYTNDWNGGSLSSGVYFYLIKTSCLNELRGPLTIAR